MANGHDTWKWTPARIGLAGVLAAAVIAGIFQLWSAVIQRGPLQPPGETASLSVAPASIKNDGTTFQATAHGFEADETVRFVWASSASGDEHLMGDVSADPSGQATINSAQHGASGMCLILAKGMQSGAKASAVLNILAGEAPALELNPNAVKNDGSTYIATARGFQPGESVRFAWATTPQGEQQVMGDISADQTGIAVIRVSEHAAPAVYVIFANGLRSDLKASAALKVVGASSR